MFIYSYGIEVYKVLLELYGFYVYILLWYRGLCKVLPELYGFYVYKSPML